MSKIYNNIMETIGHTPLIRLNNITDKNILVKLESKNPFGSSKDRTVLSMMQHVIKNNKLTEDSIIIEASSGNTGIALAAICAAMEYKAIIVMPDNVSEERKKLIMVYGAELILTPSIEGMLGAITEAKRISLNDSRYYYIDQFNNEDNVIAHYQTAEEIWWDTDGKVDIIVAGVDTSGTIMGIATYMKNRNCQVIGVLPEHPLSIPGIGAGFVPNILQKELINEIILVSLSNAINTCKILSQREGIFVGPSSGAVVFAAIEIMNRIENAGKTTVVILPDSGERYLSSEYL